jgi:predicted component of type VI protein secretion system
MVAGKSPRLRPSNNLSFYTGTVLTYSVRGEPILEFSGLGLYGVSSPLPHYFITDALDEDNQALRDFLNLFNQSIYHAYFQAWKSRHRLLFDDTNNAGFECMAALGGLREARTDLPPGLASHFVAITVNEFSLRAFLKALLPGVFFELSFRPNSWVSQDPFPRLGRGSLGDNLCLGRRILVQGRSLAIRLGPVTASRMTALLPSSPEGRLLWQWLRSYLPLSIAFHLTLIVKHDRPVQGLGPLMHLGRNAFLSPVSGLSVHHFENL